jgi:hypothetical protein
MGHYDEDSYDNMYEEDDEMDYYDDDSDAEYWDTYGEGYGWSSDDAEGWDDHPYREMSDD